MFATLKRFLGFEDPEVKEAKAKMQIDFQDPRKKHVFCVLAMDYKGDPGYLNKHSSMAVQDWYGISSPEELVRRINGYLEGGGSSPGYDAFRAAFLARAGYAVGYIDEAASWNLAFMAVQKVQQSYASWEKYGSDGYLAGHIDYCRSQGEGESTLMSIRQDLRKVIKENARELWASAPLN